MQGMVLVKRTFIAEQLHCYIDEQAAIATVKKQFEEWIEAGELCEWALVYGEYKGIPKSQVWLPAASRPHSDCAIRLHMRPHGS